MPCKTTENTSVKQIQLYDFTWPCKTYENLSILFGQSKIFRMFLVMGQSKWPLQKINKFFFNKHLCFGVCHN
jgi:hypothetical protein